MTSYRIWTDKDSLSCIDCGSQEKVAYEDRCKTCYDRQQGIDSHSAYDGWTNLIASRTEKETE